MKANKPRKILEEYQHELDTLKLELIYESELTNVLKNYLLGIKGYLVDQKRGRAYLRKNFITVPKFSYKRGNEYFKYYVAHELAHFAAHFTDESVGHSETFYEMFKLLCPEEIQYFELAYKPRSAKANGIRIR
jgi:hypothetical protein